MNHRQPGLPRKRRLGRSRGLGAAAVALLAASCISKDIEAEDRQVIFPSLRATIWNGPRSETEVVDLALEIDAAYGAGDDFQTLGVGESVTLDGMAFAGPTTLQNEVDLTTGSAAFRADFTSVGDDVRFGGAFLVGLGFTNLDIKVSNGMVAERDTLTNVGPLVGGQFHVLPVPWVELHARTSVQLGLSDDPSALVAWEVGAEFEPHPAIGIFIGWRWWNYDKEIKGSDIDLELSGLTAGLHFEF